METEHTSPPPAELPRAKSENNENDFRVLAGSSGKTTSAIPRWPVAPTAPCALIAGLPALVGHHGINVLIVPVLTS
jgi:hypothetical protein